MSEVSATPEVPQNNTIYINNLNEKIKIDGTRFFLVSATSISMDYKFFELSYVGCRVKEVSERRFHSVREDT